ncbi:MAG: ABC transporter ATP-binding protein, partial [Candidatus Thorarchaeota archaeon]
EQVLGRVEELADLLDIRKLLHRHVLEISGGEAQRVALARALAKEPRLLLLDEPLSALDPHLRERLQSEIRRVQKSLGITTIYVTHSQEEAFAISDRIAVLSNGVVLQVGTPHELYSNPSNEIVARFIGDGNIIRGRVIESSGESLLVDVNGYSFSLVGEAQVGASVLFSVKPEQVILEPDVKQRLGLGKVISVTPSVGLHKVELVFAEYHISAIIYDTQKAEVLMQRVDSDVGVSFAPGSAVVLQIEY